MQKKRVGVIGLGFIGIAHIEALRRLGNIDVVAVTDTFNADQKAEKLFVPKAYSNFQEMIDKENLDAVHICTPNINHYEMAKYAMEKGLAVMLEKPFTVTIEEAEELCALAKEKKIVNGINHSLRMNPMVMEMQELIKKGAIGDRIFAVTGSYLQDWLLYEKDWSWRLDSRLSGKTRAFSDIGTHWIDMVEMITGLKAVELLAESRIVYPTRKKPLGVVETFSKDSKQQYEDAPIDTEDWVTVLFKFDNGAIGSVNISQVTAGRKNQQVIEISGSDGSLYWENENATSLWIGHRDKANEVLVKDPSLLEKQASSLCGYPGGHNEGFPDTFKNNFKLFYQDVDRGYDNREPLYSTFEDGRREMYLIDKVYESCQKREWVKL